ncbi:MAG TPA: glycosyltransferase family 39 protein [Mycobacterium sp.]|nr:glycosyltransferase family 39 protein [Mycobacterium sp.]
MNRLKGFNPSIPTVGILLVLTGILRLINVAGSPARLDDEGTYIAQAFAIIEWGELAHYTYWYDHPPAGWLQLALWMMVSGPGFGENAVVAGRYLMVVVAVITAGLLWILARRIGLSRWAAAAAVAIYAVSPLAISLSRSVYLDNLAVAWLLGALVLICSPKHRLSAMFGGAICYGVAVLTKETLLLFVPMLAYLVWIKTAPATRRYALAVFAAVFGVVVSTYILMAVLRGELVPGPDHVSLWDGIKFQLWQRADGGAISDPGSLKRHTIDGWLQLDPVLPLLAAPIALFALFVERLRPFAIGLVILVVTIVRPGYLPVPFVITALPLMALLAAGVGEVGLARLRRATRAPSAYARHLRTAAVAAAALVASIVVSLWLPSYHSVLAQDDDAPMREAQQWITENVPKGDRLIVDDAMWADLIRDGRDRRNVIWSYKVDTDEQVQAWSPDGWADYEWVVSTASMRANMPPDGVLTDAVSHAKPAALFGSSGRRIELLRVDPGSASSKPASPAAPTFGTQVAARLDPRSNPDAVAALQSRRVDQRVVAVLSVLATTEPIVLQNISAIADEEVAGTPRRTFTLTGPAEHLSGLATFFRRQEGPFAVESAEIADGALTVRFPVGGTDITLADNPPPAPAGDASLRVADMRRTPAADRLEFLRIDGTAAGSLDPGGAPNPSYYRSMPAGTYTLMTIRDGGGPVLRQAFTLTAGMSYTLTLFSGADSTEIAAQLAPDGPPGGPAAGPTLRLLQAAADAGPVKLALAPPGGEPTVLADNASYGLVTGYAPLAPGHYDAVVTAGGREWHRPVELTNPEPTTLVLTDGPDGPALAPTPDVAGAALPLDPPALTMPAAEGQPDKPPAKRVVITDPRQQVFPLGLCGIGFVVGVALVVRTRRRQRR